MSRLKKILKAIVDVVVWGRSQGYWDSAARPADLRHGITTVQLADAVLSGAQGYDIPEPTLAARLLRWFDGKKTYSGVVLATVPAIIGVLTGFYQEVGLNATTFLRFSGITLAAVGALHKIVKILDDLTPDPQ